ncbi:MAG TPA: DUF6702 family protein [Flavisolibacter sp.]
MALLMYKWFLVSFFSVMTGMGGNFSPGGHQNGTSKAIHPFYLSVTEVNHNASTKSLEISCKLFADDLEAIIEKNNKTSLDITTGQDKTRFDAFIPAYISSHLSVSVDGKPVTMQYLGYEVDKESAYVYLEILNTPSPKKVEVNNTLLHDFINEQINILHVTVNGNRKSTKLNYPDSKASFSF